MVLSIGILDTFQVKVLHSKEVVAKIKYIPTCTHKKICPLCIFTVILFYLDVVIRESENATIKTV